MRNDSPIGADHAPSAELPATVYAIGCNIPGYLPESDIVILADPSDALDSLADAIESHVDFLYGLDPNSGDPHCPILADAERASDDLAVIRSAIADSDAEHELRTSGAYSRLIGSDHGFGGRVFFVHAMPSAELDESERAELDSDGCVVRYA